MTSSREKTSKLYEAAGLIERDALLSDLLNEGIKGIGVDRDMERKLSDGPIDLTLGGYSAVSGGYPVYVMNEDSAKAADILKQFLQDVKSQSENSKTRYAVLFERCSLFTVIVPGGFHILGLFYLLKAIRTGEKLAGPKFITASVFYLLTAIGFSVLVYQWKFGH